SRRPSADRRRTGSRRRLRVRGWSLRPVAELEQRPERYQEPGENRPEGRTRDGGAGHLRVARQAERLGFAAEQVEGVQPAEHLAVGAVEPGIGHALLLELLEPVVGLFLEFGERAELDRPRRARLGARRRELLFESVVAEGAFLGDVPRLTHVDDAERARG